MKILILLLYATAIIKTAHSQVVYCPSGAVWHYLFSPKVSGLQSNEEIRYVRDSILDGETVKVIKHTRFYVWENWVQTSNIILTVLKQTGDTIFMKNHGTQGNWQILYNFAALPGQSWRNSICEIDPFWGVPQNVANSYTVVVDSVKSVVVNNFLLKTLFVRYISNYNFPPLVEHSAQITERFGCNLFMFFYHPPGHSETHTQIDQFTNFLCYEDDTLGLKQFTNYACNSNVGIVKNPEFITGIKIYPNPVTDKLSVDFTTWTETSKGILVNCLGQIIYSFDKLNSQQEIEMKPLRTGIYYLKIQTDSGQNSFKIVKN
ncbi:MAG: T9SS type A sorting domain-containing protein [Bacteroidota bacterium]